MFKFRRPCLKGTPSFWYPICQILSFPYVYLPKNFIGLALKIKKFEFCRTRLGVPLIAPPTISGGHQYFWMSIVARSVIHVRFLAQKKIVKEEKKRKKKKIRKNFIQGGINKYNHDKVVSSMFKKHNLFSLISILIETYRLKIVHFFADFQPLKSRSSDWAPSNLVRIQSLSAPKLCWNFRVPRSKFVVISKLVNFRDKNGSFFSNLEFLSHDYAT